VSAVERPSAATAAVRTACEAIARLSAASLCAIWITLRGGVLFGLFPALSALVGLARAVLDRREEAPVWTGLTARARRDFVPANLAGWSAALPLAAALAWTAATGRVSVGAVALALVSALALPVAIAVSAWIALPLRLLPVAPFLLAAAMPHRAALAGSSMAAAAALWLLHPLVAVYFGPALAALAAAAVLRPLATHPLLSRSDASSTR
jgi:uncharacterized membrane protein YesL